MLEAIYDLILGCLGLGVYVSMTIGTKLNRSEGYRKVYKDAGGNVQGLIDCLDRYFDENPFAHITTVLWVVAVALCGDMPIVTEYLPEENGRHAVFFLNGLGAHNAIDRLSAMFVKG